MVNNQFNNESVYRSYLPPLIATALLILLGNGLLYYYYYSDVFWPQTLPYFEDFAGAERIDFRQVGGNWQLDEDNARLIQNDTNLVDILAVIPALELEPEQPYEFSSNISVLEGPKGGGIVFNMQDRGTIVSSHLIRLGNNEGGDYLIYGYFADDRNFTVQGSASPENLPSEFKLGVKVEGKTYSVLLNDVVIEEGVELMHEGGNLALTSWKSKVAFDDVSVIGPDQTLPIVVEEGEASAAAADPAPAAQTEAAVVQQAQAAPAIQPQTQTVVADQQNAGVAVVPAIGELPYFENFTGDTDLDYRVINGDWELQDETVTQVNPQLVDVVATVPGLSMADNEPYSFNADLTMLEGAKGGGLVFNMQQPDSVRESHMLRLGQRQDGGEYFIYGYFDGNRGFNTQGTGRPLEYDTETTLGIQVNENTYDIVQDDQTLIRDIPLVYKGGRPGLTTWNSAVQFDNIEVTSPNGARSASGATTDQPAEAAVASANESTGSLPWLEDFTGDTDHTFIEAGGNWQLREETMLQLNTEASDIMALVPELVLTTNEPYDFSADLLILEGPKGGGLVFNSQNIDSIRESHMVRFGSNDGNDYMIYGYFDENRSFNAQGSAQPPAFADEAQLGVSISGSTYNILVNDEIVARDIPLVYLGGRVGLTTWNSSVGFDDIEIISPFADEALETTANVDLFANPRPVNTYFTADLDTSTDPSNWGIVNGDWIFSDDGITHPNAEWFDNLIMHANPFDRYAFTTNMQMGEGEGGSGVAFNIPAADTINGAHIARYLGDDVLTWGYFDEGGVYVEQGSVTVESAGTDVHKFEIRVDGENYSVRLDDELLDEGVPLYTTQGRVGFTSTLREVTFDDIVLTELETAAEG